MASALKLPRTVNDIIYSFRDWKLERVKREGGTPTATLFGQKPGQFHLDHHPEHIHYTYENGRIVKTEYETSWAAAHLPYDSVAVYECVEDYLHLERTVLNLSKSYPDLGTHPSDLWWECELCREPW